MTDPVYKQVWGQIDWGLLQKIGNKFHAKIVQEVDLQVEFRVKQQVDDFVWWRVFQTLG